MITAARRLMGIRATATGGATNFVENFNRADSSTTGNGWAVHNGTATFPIVSNQMGFTATTTATSYNIAPFVPANADQYAQMSVGAVVSSAGQHPHLGVRFSNSGATVTGYFFRYNISTNAYEITQIVAGTGAVIASASASAPTAPYTIRFEASGTNLVGKINGTQVISYVSSSITQVGKVVVGVRWTNTADNGQRVDDFTCGNLVASVVSSGNRYYNTTSTKSAINAASTIAGVAAAMTTMGDAYGMTFEFATSDGSQASTTWTGTALSATKLADIKQYAVILAEEFSKYRPTFVLQIAMTKFTLYDRVYTATGSEVGAFYGNPNIWFGLQITSGGDLSVLSAQQNVARTMHHEFGHAIDATWTGTDDIDYTAWDASNPAGFTYGASNTWATIVDGHLKGFVGYSNDKYACTNHTEDYAQVHSAVMAEPRYDELRSWLATSNDPTLAAKVALHNAHLAKHDTDTPSMGSNAYYEGINGNLAPASSFYDTIAQISGLKHYYPLNGASVVNDMTGFLHGTNNGATFGADGATFSGTTYVQIPDSPDWSVPGSPNSAITIIAFLTVTNWAGGTPKDAATSDPYVHWMGKGVSGAYEWVLRHYVDTSVNRPKRMGAYHYNVSGSSPVGSVFQDTTAAGVEQVIGAMYDTTTTTLTTGDASATYPGAVSIWRDGTKRDEDGFDGGTLNLHIVPTDTTTPVRIGTRGDASGFLIGKVRRVAVFNRKLTAAEMTAIYNARNFVE